MQVRKRATCLRGFTLIELLVALSLLSLLSLLLIEGLRLGSTSWERVRSTTFTLQRAQAAQRGLRVRMERMLPNGSVPGMPAETRLVTGAKDELKFTAPWPQDPVRGLMQYRIFVDPQRASLKLGWKPFSYGNENKDLENTETMLDNVRSIELGYLSAAEGAQPAWLDRWDAATGAPALIRLRVTFDQHGATDAWPLFEVHPRIDALASCQFDAVSRRCR
jgi:general secretion pathway protein J